MKELTWGCPRTPLNSCFNEFHVFSCSFRSRALFSLDGFALSIAFHEFSMAFVFIKMFNALGAKPRDISRLLRRASILQILSFSYHNMTFSWVHDPQGFFPALADRKTYFLRSAL